MFTGIIESLGKVVHVDTKGTNKTFWISSEISNQLRTDQSVCHNGVCLTVEEVNNAHHRVTAVEETLKKSNLDIWENDSLINLERSLKVDGLLDGHLVQGHVDTQAVCIEKIDHENSWEFVFEFPKKFSSLVIEKGSICLNGISLTVYNVKKKKFTVAIIPHTFHHTNICKVDVGSSVNIEFDMVGKYILRKFETEK